MPRPRNPRELYRINLNLDLADYQWMRRVYGDQHISETIREMIRRLRQQAETAAEARARLEDFE